DPNTGRSSGGPASAAEQSRPAGKGGSAEGLSGEKAAAWTAPPRRSAPMQRSRVARMVASVRSPLALAAWALLVAGCGGGRALFGGTPASGGGPGGEAASSGATGAGGQGGDPASGATTGDATAASSTGAGSGGSSSSASTGGGGETCTPPVSGGAC